MPVFEKDEILRWFGEELLEYRAMYLSDMDVIRLDYGDHELGFDGLKPGFEDIPGFTTPTEDGPKHVYSPENWIWEWVDEGTSAGEEYA